MRRVCRRITQGKRQTATQRTQKRKRAGCPKRTGPRNFALLFLTRVVCSRLTAQRRQAGLAVSGSRWAQKERASISGGHRLNARCKESADHHGGQNRDLRYQLCIRLYLHCRLPLGPGEFLLGLIRGKCPCVKHDAFQSWYMTRLPSVIRKVAEKEGVM